MRFCPRIQGVFDASIVTLVNNPGYMARAKSFHSKRVLFRKIEATGWDGKEEQNGLLSLNPP
jgi:hypothetical protein